MTFVLYFGYQNSRAIHTEKGILPVQYVGLPEFFEMKSSLIRVQFMISDLI
jgi:hypothetical protein